MPRLHRSLIQALLALALLWQSLLAPAAGCMPCCLDAQPCCWSAGPNSPCPGCASAAMAAADHGGPCRAGPTAASPQTSHPAGVADAPTDRIWRPPDSA